MTSSARPSSFRPAFFGLGAGLCTVLLVAVWALAERTPVDDSVRTHEGRASDARAPSEVAPLDAPRRDVEREAPIGAAAGVESSHAPARVRDLHVLAADTGAAVGRVRWSHVLGRTPPISGRGGLDFNEADTSPVAVSAAACELWVGAQGRAWERIALEAGDAPCSVELSAGGALEARFDGALKALHEVVLELEDRVVARFDPPPARGLDLVGLTPGLYTLRLLAVDSGRVLAETRSTCVVEPAGLAHVVLEVPDDASTFARVAGRLRMNEIGAWYEAGLYQQLSLRLERTDVEAAAGGRRPSRRIGVRELERIAGSNDLGWSFDTLVPGTYRLEVAPVAHEVEFVVTDTGLEDVLVDVPPLAMIEVYTPLIGEATSSPATRVAAQRLLPVGGARRLREKVDGVSRVSRFHCAPGPVRIDAWGAGLLPAHETVEAHPGPNLVVLDLERVPELELFLADPMPSEVPDFDWWADVRVRALGHSGELASHYFQLEGGASQPGGLHLKLTRPGRYAIELPPHTDGADGQQFTVDVHDGTDNRLAIALGAPPGTAEGLAPR